MRRTLAIAALFALVLAGCGGDDDSESSAPPTTTTTVAAGTATPGSIDTNFTGEGGETFCGLLRSYQEQRDRLSNTNLTDLKPLMTEAETGLKALVAAAPAEIKSDALVVAAGFERLLTVLEGVNYDATKLNPDALAGLQTPEIQASSERLEAYSQKICGITTTVP
jgi:hypothetical protein